LAPYDRASGARVLIVDERIRKYIERDVHARVKPGIRVEFANFGHFSY
jgi:hypothetical protein